MSQIILEDGSTYFLHNSFIVEFRTNEMWVGVISEHQEPLLFSADEVISKQNMEYVNVKQL
jgi:hypothetical protein